MKKYNSVVSDVITLLDGRTITRITCRRVKKFLKIIPYMVESVCYVPRPGHALLVAKRMERGRDIVTTDFAAPRLVIFESWGGHTAACTCGWRYSLKFQSGLDPDERGLIHLMDVFIKHAGRAHATTKADDLLLSVVK